MMTPERLRYRWAQPVTRRRARVALVLAVIVLDCLLGLIVGLAGR